jgi:replicative DNA helicase Mcm
VTGFSKGKRDLIRRIKEVIRQMADDSGRSQIDEVIEQVSREGYPKDEIRKQIDMFLRQGEAMEPRPGIIKLI